MATNNTASFTTMVEVDAHDLPKEMSEAERCELCTQSKLSILITAAMQI